MTDQYDNDDLPLQGLLEQTLQESVGGHQPTNDLGLPEAPAAAPPIAMPGSAPPPTAAPPPAAAQAEPAAEPRPVKARMKSHREDWQTKPTDRFVLKLIKEHISAQITPGLAGSAITPLMVTVTSAVLGVTAGVLFALGWGWIGALVAALAQILDGVDGQLARYTGRESDQGAFWDSVLDRYADGALMVGLVVYLARLPYFPVPVWIIVLMGSLAIIGCNLISYTTARAASLKLDIGPPTLASKGTRTTVIVICGLVSAVLPQFPLIALVYLALHPNAEVILRLARAGNEEAPHVVHQPRRDPRPVPGAAQRSPEVSPGFKIEMPPSAGGRDKPGSPPDRRGPGGSGPQQR